MNSASFHIADWLGLSDEVSRAARTVECRIRDLIDTWSEA